MWNTLHNIRQYVLFLCVWVGQLVAFSGRMGIKEVEDMLVKNWVSTGASMDDTRKRLLCFSDIAFLTYLGRGLFMECCSR